MRCILMSFKPRWIERIAFRVKSVEIRKKVPKYRMPFKVLMYCTNDRKETLNVANGHGFGKKGDLYLNGNCYYPYTFGSLNGKIVGEFVCDDVFAFKNSCLDVGFNRAVDEGCIDPKILALYLDDKVGFGLHISELKIYDTPKKLVDFNITRPPQSWCYVEELL